MQNETTGIETAHEVAPDYRSPHLSPDDRVVDLLKRMTLEEKVAQMLCIWGTRQTTIIGADGKMDLASARKHLGDGIGQIGRISDLSASLNARAMAALANEMQKFFVEETRLGIPVIFHEECLHGLAGKEATSYPQPIALASSFDPDLIEHMYAAIAEDARMRGAHQALTPVVDVARDPRWGRVEETFGEDPYLVGSMGVAAVNGFQGTGEYRSGRGVLATIKHFAAHGEPESGTNCAPVNISERLLRDTFLSPFKRVIQEAHPASVMASYNEIDGVPSHANRWLLRDVLRTEWGFEGFVVTDYYAITELHAREITHGHGVANSKREAALLAARAGLNIELPDPDCYPHLVDLVRDGELNEEVLDDLVAPMLRAKFELGLFENPYVDLDAVHGDKKLERDGALALRTAEESIVLLKNNAKALPLDVRKKQTIAVIGPCADRQILGGYSGTPKHFVTVLQGIRDKVGNRATVLHAEGCQITVGGAWNEDTVTFPQADDDRRMIEQAIETATQADTVILVLGENEQTSREAWSKTHLGDRTSLELYGMQLDLARAMIATGKPIILLLLNGRPNSITPIQEGMHAILECWYLGQENGTAIANILFGDVNPSGKLPISIPRSVGHIPCYYNYKPSARRGYIDSDVSALYSFGYGLSYTSFRYSNLRLAKTKILTGESTHVSVDITNSGDRDGVEVPQLYVRDVVSSVTRPVKELKGFQRTSLKRGETVTVTLPITPEHLSFTNIDMRWVVEPGDFEIMVGSSSRDEDLLKTTLTVQ